MRKLKAYELTPDYTLVVKRKENGSNYDLNAYVLRDKEVLFGTIFRSDTNSEDIKSWAMQRIKKREEELNSIFNDDPHGLLNP